jgi:hypothetical protein
MVKAFFLDTYFVITRPQRLLTHAFYTTSKPLVSREFRDITNAEEEPDAEKVEGEEADAPKRPMIVELRGTKADGSIGKQTMLPPSLHPEGEHIEFLANGEITHADDLPTHVTHYAIACLLLKYLCHRGFGHDVRLAVAGLLLRDCGLDEAAVVRLVRALAEATKNNVKDAELTVRTTAVNLRNHRPIKGRAALVKILGDNGKAVVARIGEWLSLGEAGPNDVVMRGGDLSVIVDRAEAALLRQTPIYQRSGQLVRPVQLDAPTNDEGVRRALGSTILRSVSEPWLLEQMGRVLHWRKPAKAGLVRADPKPVYARTLLSRAEWKFPVLRGVITTPTLTNDGRIIQTPGYDADSRLLLNPSATFPLVPDEPSQDDAYFALQRLAQPLRGFPFDNDTARSVALAAMLTALVRMSLRHSPLHVFDAPTAGTGKSLLAEAVGLLATGVKPAAMSQGKSPEEDEKRLSTVLMAGDPVIHIDNCELALSGDFLCSMLTQEVVQARVLGLSERQILPSTALVLASGNNLTLIGDVSRRAVICRLDARVERPDTRDFDFDCHEEVQAERPDLVVAGLTVLRAYHVAGRPVKLPAMGSFPDYAWIRGALVWLGCADPADTRESILDADPRRDELINVMELWKQEFQEQRVEVAEIQSRSDRLTQLFTEIACRGKTWSARSVGWWLRRHKDRVVNGQSFRCTGLHNHTQWWLTSQQANLLFPNGTPSVRETLPEFDDEKDEE